MDDGSMLVAIYYRAALSQLKSKLCKQLVLLRERISHYFAGMFKTICNIKRTLGHDFQRRAVL